MIMVDRSSNLQIDVSVPTVIAAASFKFQVSSTTVPPPLREDAHKLPRRQTAGTSLTHQKPSLGRQDFQSLGTVKERPLTQGNFAVFGLVGWEVGDV